MGKEMKWTDAQRQAIQRRGGNLLVAAAAGSGKTAVLVERIIQRILDPTDPWDLDRILVVTFTEAAAAEMRNRIGRAIEQALQQDSGNRHLQKQLALLNKAAISTLHSFCLSLVRRYFYRLGLDPKLTVMSESEALLLQQETLEQVLEREYARGRDEFLRVAEFFGSRHEEGLRRQILSLSGFLATMPFPRRWLERALAPYADTAPTAWEAMPWYPEFLAMLTVKMETARWYHSQAVALAGGPGGPAEYSETLQAELTGMEEFLHRCRQGLPWEELSLLGREQDNFPRLKAVKKETVDEEIKEQVSGYRNRSKKIIKEELLPYFQRTREEIQQEIRDLGPVLRELADLVQQLQQEYQAAKRSKGQVDFHDLEHYCLQLLVAEDEGGEELCSPSDLALTLKRQYLEVMVDEYQDTNDLQEAILQLVSRQGEEQPNLFMVGDVKQSIYGFRQANPGLFLQKYRNYPRITDGPQSKILLSANFRSRREVVDGVNFFFRRLMTPEVGELAYDEEEELIYQAHYPEPEGNIPLAAGPVEVHLLNDAATVAANAPSEAGPDEDLSAFEKEAILMAARLRELVGLAGQPPVQVWDRKMNAYRPAAWRDIVILLRSPRGRGTTLLEVFQQYGIPAYAELGIGYFQATEVSIILSLLRIIDNPLQDIPLVGVLRSPLLGLTTEELAMLRAAAPHQDFFRALKAYVHQQPESELGRRLQEFLSQLERWRTLARRGPLSRLIWQIYQDTAFLDYGGAMPGGKQRQANLQALYHRAREFDGFARHGLFRFLRFIGQLQDRDEDLGLAGAYGESDDVVRVMSIHKSKGLEFPVVFVADLGRQFNLLDLRHDLLLHQELGFGPLYFNEAYRIKYPAAPHWAVRAALHRAHLAEELRVLYVAFTRAREKLILVGSAKKLEETRAQWQLWATGGEALPLPVLTRANNFLDWLGPALTGQGDVVARETQRKFAVHYWGLDGGQEVPRPVSVETPPDLPWEALRNLLPWGGETKADQAQLTRQLTWEYPFMAATTKPAKLAATELKKYLLAEDPDARPIFKRSALLARPLFMQAAGGLTGAELGTAWHLVMQHLDFQAADTEEQIMVQLEQLVAREFITAEQAQGVNRRQLWEFCQGPLGQRLKRTPAWRLKRELPFTLAVSAGEIYGKEAGDTAEEVIVQGIIDCLLMEEDGMVLIDYKTDYLRSQDIPRVTADYRYQLELYARAVAEIFAVPVKEKYLHFFHLQQTVSVD